MTAAAELTALRGVARNLGASSGPVDPRRARAWSSVLLTSARNLGRYVEFLRAEADGRAAEVDATEGDEGYSGLDLETATQRYAALVVKITSRALVAGGIESASVGDLAEERRRFLRHVEALNASRSVPTGRGVARVRPDASGAGLAQTDGRATAKLAALQALAKTGTNRRKILDAVAGVARDPRVVGLTDLQIAQQTGLRDNSVRPRRVELVDGGWLQPATSSNGTPVTRQHYGREHTVWVLTQRAAGSPELLSGMRRA